MLDIKAEIKNIGCLFVGIAILIGALFILSLFIKVGVWFADTLFPLFIYASICLLILDIVLFLPLSLFKNTKLTAGKWIFFSSYLFGITLWIWCLILTYKAFGWVGILIGVILLGIGIVPVGFIGALFTGQILIVLYLILLILITYGARRIGSNILMKFTDHDSSGSGTTTRHYSNGDTIDVDYTSEDDKH
ncbi:MAG TPA: hypothetical protein QF753_14860 [Victivallales bacterium]|nr:hypothetical protein [Victivallales bacterium]